jgi:hypothetical protein
MAGAGVVDTVADRSTVMQRSVVLGSEQRIDVVIEERGMSQ